MNHASKKKIYEKRRAVTVERARYRHDIGAPSGDVVVFWLCLFLLKRVTPETSCREFLVNANGLVGGENVGGLLYLKYSDIYFHKGFRG